MFWHRIPKDFLDGRVALVTGAAQGIGWAVSLALSTYGAKVYICDISDDKLASAEARLLRMELQDRIFIEKVNISSQDQVNTWVTRIAEREKRIDILVNNAAFVKWENDDNMTVDDIVRTMDVGYNGMVYATKAVKPYMEKSESGHVVNMGSSAGRLFVSTSAAYAATKAAIDAYTQTLTFEQNSKAIIYTIVRPAAVAGTGFFKESVSTDKLPRMADFIPPLQPPQVARKIIDALYYRRKKVNIPGYLRIFYMVFFLFPGLFRWLVSAGGKARKDIGAVEWECK